MRRKRQLQLIPIETNDYFVKQNGENPRFFCDKGSPTGVIIIVDNPKFIF